MGCLARLEQPSFAVPWAVGIFARAYKIDLQEISEPVESYKSVADFFIRDLKPGQRPIESQLVSPVDGRLRGVEQISDTALLTQVKDRRFAIKKLLANDSGAQKYIAGTALTLYLAPHNYHHVHSPVSGTIKGYSYIPGALWPVNDWSFNAIKELFAINERLVIYIDSAFGEVAVVMVGATNVGRMRLTFADLVTNSCPWANRTVQHHTLPVPQAIKAGERIGTFELGSTVVMLLQSQAPAIRAELRQSSDRVMRLGQTLI